MGGRMGGRDDSGEGDDGEVWMGGRMGGRDGDDSGEGDDGEVGTGGLWCGGDGGGGEMREMGGNCGVFAIVRCLEQHRWYTIWCEE